MCDCGYSMSGVAYICISRSDSYCALTWSVERSHKLLPMEGVTALIYSVSRLCRRITPSLPLQAWPKFSLPLLARPPLFLLQWQHVIPDGGKTVQCDWSLWASLLSQGQAENYLFFDHTCFCIPEYKFIWHGTKRKSPFYSCHAVVMEVTFNHRWKNTMFVPCCNYV